MNISLENIKVGMCVGQDLYTQNGQLITPRQTFVTPSILQKLKKFNIMTVEITNDNLPDNIFEVITKESFKVFQNRCLEANSGLTSALSNIAKENLDIRKVEDIKNIGEQLYIDNLKNFNLLNMIYNIRTHSDIVYAHSVNVGMIAGHLGHILGFSGEDVKFLITCGLFHDIGKLLIPKEILEKPGKLSEDEMKIMQSHTTKGFELLDTLDNVDDRIKKVALLHHERCDGMGYPMNLKEAQLDDFSKIIAIADTYEAMTTNRSYREEICPFDVASYFERDGLLKFDPNFLLKFVDEILVAHLQTSVLLSNNKAGKIILINRNQKSKPLVGLADGTFIDLAKNSEVSIVDMIS